MTNATNTTNTANTADTADDHEHFLVLGASGAQGGAVAHRLLSNGHRVRGAGRGTTAPPRYARFGAAYDHATVDLADASAVSRAFEGITRASVTLPMVYGERAVARLVANVADAARAAGVRRLVLNTGNRLPDAPEATAEAFTTRRAAAGALLDSGVPAVVLRPPVYLENLRAPWVAERVATEGVLAYPLPAHAPVAWLAHADLAAATEAALTADGVPGTSLDLGGAEAVTGDELAARLGAALGRDVVYRALDPDAFEAALAPVAGPEAAAAVAATYRWAARDPKVYAADTSGAWRALGARPTPLSEWLASWS